MNLVLIVLLVSLALIIMTTKVPERFSRSVAALGSQDESTYVAFNNLCYTKDPYYNKSDVYWWWKFLPFYWQSQYKTCDKYGCNKEGLALHDAYCSSMKPAEYKERDSKPELFYENRELFCKQNPRHGACPPGSSCV